jgi:Uma2 family endonuclease
MAIVQREDEVTTIVLANRVPGPRQGCWTYEAYAALPEDGMRYEIMQGVLSMTPAPEPEHQRISKKIAFCLYTHIDAQGLGEIFYAPIDVTLGADLFQPDVLVILHEHLDRIQAKRIVGAPDLIVEILSPGSLVTDRVIKRSAYERAGVAEYWLVDPKQKAIEVFVLENDIYVSVGLFTGEQRLVSRIVPEIAVPVAQFFG